ncbi:helix-turn-helix domain-containing protein [Actinokineospora globicatena]|uniref:helix-turn-helix domain-containing protein n=1 Tax=Actinokineospora globicatena TaxID=103729 RepID=UPI0020A452C3|nr:helix-turn-helix transcriptional regulator [Actinokineospora globicatena]MCP2301144.1 Helix-turn-helix domain-containing protein [Actinokineospora globicatena]GLW77220.1 transcriptional regulator [Actinokineospora globicatena]GLW84054.1 transcriptional regulator [Actinokineospora globicatena]
MRETTTGSTVPRRQLGRYLRELRGRARLTVRAAAAELEWSETKIWRIETGQTPLRSLDTEAMCKIYGASEELTDYLKTLSKKTKEQGWWHGYGDVIPDGFGLYIGLEEAVSSMQCYETSLIPGLLQTPHYSRMLIKEYKPLATDDEIERRVELRSARQALLTRSVARPSVSVVLNEAILRRPVGGPKVMAHQLIHLAELAQLDTVHLRVIPFAVGMYHGLITGPFVIMRFPNNGTRDSEPPVVFIEHLAGELFLDKPSEVELYGTTFHNTWTTSLDEQASLHLIRQAAKEFRQ